MHDPASAQTTMPTINVGRDHLFSCLGRQYSKLLGQWRCTYGLVRICFVVHVARPAEMIPVCN